jgi:TRAP-type C4-dicarboxylate transport system substrate-binding protein
VKILNKTNMTRRALLLATAAGMTSLALPTGATAQTSYDVPIIAGLNASEGQPTHSSIARIAHFMAQDHGITVDLQVHPSSTLGTDISQLDAVQSGFIGITSNSSGQFAQFSDAMNFVDLPYAITSWDMAERLFASDLWAEQVAQFEADSGLIMLPPVTGGGFRIFWNTEGPIPTPAETQGIPVRTTNSPSELAMFRDWGANPTPLAWTETYGGLQNGLIQGIHVQPIWTHAARMYEVVSHGTDVGAVFAVQLQVMNRNVFEQMPPEVQTAFMDAAEKAAAEARAADRELEDQFRQQLLDEGMIIHTPSDDEMALWRAGGEEVWSDVGAIYDADFFQRLSDLR